MLIRTNFLNVAVRIPREKGMLNGISTNLEHEPKELKVLVNLELLPARVSA